MPSIEYDIKFLQAGLVDLEGYLLSKELYWPVLVNSPPGEAPYPRMTLGSLLLTLKRLQAENLPPEQQTEVNRQAAKLANVRQKWKVAWDQKARREFSSRLSLWRDFLEDYRQNPEANSDRYNYEAARRVMLDILKPEAEGIADTELELLSGLDGLLRSVFVSGPFIWEERLKGGFPQPQFWYLYGRPRETKSS